nr:hypothetical protein [Tanacetum cinerariifolium]
LQRRLRRAGGQIHQGRAVSRCSQGGGAGGRGGLWRGAILPDVNYAEQLRAERGHGHHFRERELAPGLDPGAHHGHKYRGGQPHSHHSGGAGHAAHHGPKLFGGGGQ